MSMLNPKQVKKNSDKTKHIDEKSRMKIRDDFIFSTDTSFSMPNLHGKLNNKFSKQVDSMSDISQTLAQPNLSKLMSINYYENDSKSAPGVKTFPGISDKVTRLNRTKSVSWCDENVVKERKNLSRRDSENDLKMLKKVPIMNSNAESSINKVKKFNSLKVKVDLSQSKYEIVRRVATQMNFDITKDAWERSNLIWIDDHVSMEMVSKLTPLQRINHFPFMDNITRKHLLAREVTRCV